MNFRNYTIQPRYYITGMVLFVLIAILPASAYYIVAPNISQGATVFIGEQGLNITHALNQAQVTSGFDGVPTYNTIAWWAYSSDVGNTIPSKTIDVTTRFRNFMVVPVDFIGSTGNWYLVGQDGRTLITTGVGGNPLVFTIADPALDLKIWDATRNVDVTGLSVNRSENLTFRIDTNMYSAINAGNRFPVYNNTNDGYMDIKVTDASGRVYTTLLNNSITSHGTANNLTAQNVSAFPWFWGAPFTTPGSLNNWATGARYENESLVYPAGTYTISAESLLNNMKDNYRNAGADFTGKTVSQAYTITILSLPGKIGVFRNGLWVIDYNGNYAWDGPSTDRVVFLGQSGDNATIGDWNGNGKGKIGIFRNGLWVIDYNGNYAWDGTTTDRAVFLGQAGDTPVVGNWSGSGTGKIGIFRNGLWVLDYNGNFQWDGTTSDRAVFLGQAGDNPVVGNWNGDSTGDKIGVFRNGLWVLDFNGNYQWDGTTSDRAIFLGQAGDIPVVGDWNGDGKDEIGVFRNGLWVLDYNGNYQWDGPSTDRAVFLGQAGDTPVVGDWNGDGKDKIGVFRNGLWVLDYNGNYQWDGTTSDRAVFLGQAGDTPVVGKW